MAVAMSLPARGTHHWASGEAESGPLERPIPGAVARGGHTANVALMQQDTRRGRTTLRRRARDERPDLEHGVRRTSTTRRRAARDRRPRGGWLPRARGIGIEQAPTGHRGRGALRRRRGPAEATARAPLTPGPIPLPTRRGTNT